MDWLDFGHCTTYFFCQLEDYDCNMFTQWRIIFAKTRIIAKHRNDLGSQWVPRLHKNSGKRFFLRNDWWIGVQCGKTRNSFSWNQALLWRNFFVKNCEGKFLASLHFVLWNMKKIVKSKWLNIFDLTKYSISFEVTTKCGKKRNLSHHF